MTPIVCGESRANWKTRSRNSMMFRRRPSSAGNPARSALSWIHNGSLPTVSRQERSSASCRARTVAGRPEASARDNREFQVEAGLFFTRADDLQQVVVGVHGGRPVYLRDVVEKIEDGPAEPDNYVLFANAKGTSAQAANSEYPAVTITLAKRKGTNASIIADHVLEKVECAARLHAARRT